MLRKWSTFIYILLMIAHIFTNQADGLSCKFCQAINNYNNCISSAGLVECNDALVNMTHLLLNPHNPSLGKVPPASQYQCFQVNYTTNGIWNYHMGCSFAGSNICAGWKVLSQCKISNKNEGQVATVKMADKSTSQLLTSAVTPNGVLKSAGGTQSTKHAPSGFSTTTVGIVVQSNSSSASSTFPPKIVSSTKDSIKRKTPSKASVSSLQLEVLVIFWITILLWRHY